MRFLSTKLIYYQVIITVMMLMRQSYQKGSTNVYVGPKSSIYSYNSTGSVISPPPGGWWWVAVIIVVFTFVFFLLFLILVSKCLNVHCCSVYYCVFCCKCSSYQKWDKLYKAKKCGKTQKKSGGEIVYDNDHHEPDINSMKQIVPISNDDDLKLPPIDDSMRAYDSKRLLLNELNNTPYDIISQDKSLLQKGKNKTQGPDDQTIDPSYSSQSNNRKQKMMKDKVDVSIPRSHYQENGLQQKSNDLTSVSRPIVEEKEESEEETEKGIDFYGRKTYQKR